MTLLTTTTICILLILLIMSATKREKWGYITVYDDCYEYNNFLIFLFAAILVVVEGFRHAYGDTNTYVGLYNSVADNISTVIELAKQHHCVGWNLFQWLLRNFSKNARMLFIACALIINVFNIRFIKKFSTDLPFSLFLFFVFRFLDACNGIRQLTAAAILTIAFSSILEKKYFRYILLVLALSTIHRSILVMIPLLFIFAGKRWNILLKLFVVFCAFSIFIRGPLNTLLTVFADEEYANFNYDASANILHVLVAAVPLVLGIIYHRNHLDNIGDNRATDIFINLQAVNFSFTVLALIMAQYIRISWYLFDASVIITPFLIDQVFEGNNKQLIKILAYALYFMEFMLINASLNAGNMFNGFYLEPLISY